MSDPIPGAGFHSGDAGTVLLGKIRCGRNTSRSATDGAHFPARPIDPIRRNHSS